MCVLVQRNPFVLFVLSESKERIVAYMFVHKKAEFACVKWVCVVVVLQGHHSVLVSNSTLSCWPVSSHHTVVVRGTICGECCVDCCSNIKISHGEGRVVFVNYYLFMHPARVQCTYTFTLCITFNHYPWQQTILNLAKPNHFLELSNYSC